jgi:phosphatidyl-myo-inositol alpha-mannosyltransferase
MPWQVFAKVRTPRFWTFHDTPGPGLTGRALTSVFRILAGAIAKRADGLIAVSDGPMAHLGRAAARGGVRVVPPAVDLTRFLALTQDRPAGAPIVLHWGRLDRRKNIATLIAAAQLFAQGQSGWPAHLPQPRFLVAGDGADAGLVRAAAARSDNIRLLPSPDQPELLRLLAQASLCVFPAAFGESFGLVLAEAMASGTPVLAGDNPGYRAHLGPLGPHMLFDPGDAAGLARRIVECLTQPGTTRALTATARLAAERSDIRHYLPELEDVYATAVSGWRRSQGEGSGNQA